MSTMKYTITERPEMLIAGVAIRTSNAENTANDDIARAWKQFYAQETANRIPNAKSPTLYGAYLDYVGDYTKPFTLLIGCEVTSEEGISDEWVVKRIPAAKYAHFAVKGEFPNTLLEQWQEVWESDLPRRYSVDLEVYTKAFEQEPPQVDLLISLMDQ